MHFVLGISKCPFLETQPADTDIGCSEEEGHQVKD